MISWKGNLVPSLSTIVSLSFLNNFELSLLCYRGTSFKVQGGSVIAAFFWAHNYVSEQFGNYVEYGICTHFNMASSKCGPRFQNTVAISLTVSWFAGNHRNTKTFLSDSHPYTSAIGAGVSLASLAASTQLAFGNACACHH